jgi:hypothetical protein
MEEKRIDGGEKERKRKERKMKIIEERRSCRGRDKKRNVLLIWIFFTNDVYNDQLNINI